VARSRDIRRLFLRQSLAVPAMGVALGLPLAWISSRVWKIIVFGVSPHDWWAPMVVSLALLAISVAAAQAASWRGLTL
jgi:ABC-type antimicrobial peptide transport system permease subunit